MGVELSRLAALALSRRRVRVLNNDWRGFAPANARALVRSLGRRGASHVAGLLLEYGRSLSPARQVTGTLSPVLEVSSGHDDCEVEVRRRDLRHTGDVPAADRLVQ
jgi:hypothetical protein